MDTTEFLRAMWPATGLYCIATPFKRGYAHHIFDTVRDAVQFCDRKRGEENLFFCVHTLKSHEGVFSETKINWRTNLPGANEKRCQENMAFGQDFFFDLDVGESTKQLIKYNTQQEALAGIKAFCKATLLPKPYLVSSGGGVHVHWLLDEPIESREWQKTALKLKALAIHLDLHVDPARTDDCASIMRVAGTFNLKPGKGKRPVEVLMEGVRTPNAQFIRLIEDAIIRLDVPAIVVAKPHAATAGPLGNNMTPEWEGPPVTFQALWDTCQQVRDFEFTSGAEFDEPARYDMIGVVRLVEDGRRHIDSLTAGRDSVTVAEIDQKIVQWEGKGATSCLKISRSCGAETCKKCPFWSKQSNPLTNARRHGETLPAPTVLELVGQTLVETAIPDAPWPFVRKSGGVFRMVAGDEDDGPEEVLILDHDLYPVRRKRSTADNLRQHVWCAELPMGAQEFNLDAASLCDLNKMASILAAEEIYPGGNLKDVVSYMSAYIKLMRDTLNPDPEYNHLGWEGTKEDPFEKFIMPEYAILADGSHGPVQIDKDTQRSSRDVGAKGDLNKQIELLKFYNKPEFFAQQFIVLCGLAAPTFYMTGHHGVIVSTWGKTGGSKTTAVFTAASLWGRPEKYTINGTRKGMTEIMLNERINIYKNLPICVDETTHMSDIEVQNLAEGVTQATGRTRANRSGKERISPGGEKATILCTSSNSSMHDKLSKDNASGTAGSMRVFEMHVKPITKATKEEEAGAKAEAMAFMQALNQNYGHIGPYFLAQIMPLRDRIEARIRIFNEAIDRKYGLSTAERFWSAVVADVLVIGRLAARLGLVPYDMDVLEHWLMTTQLAEMRGVLEAEYSTPIDRLTNYMSEISASIVFVAPGHSAGVEDSVVSQNRGELRARYERKLGIMWVLKNRYKDYCTKLGANFSADINELIQQKIILNPRCKKVLGAGAVTTDTAQVWCFTIDMKHPEIRSGDLKLLQPGARLKLVSS